MLILLQNIFSRMIVLYLLLGSLLFIIIDKGEIKIHFFNRARLLAEYVRDFEKGKVPFDEKQFRQTAIFYEVLYEYLPSKALALGNLGFIYYYLKDVESSAEYYRRAMGMDSTLVSFYYDMGVISVQLKRLKEAEVFFKESLKVLPLTEYNYESLTGIAEKLNKKELAEDIDKLKKRLKEDEKQLYIHLASINFEKEDYQQMHKVALRGMQKFPDDVKMPYHEGLVLYKLKNYAEAVVYFSRAISIDPNYVSSYYYRSLCFKELSQRENMQKDLARLVELEGKGMSDKKYQKDMRLHFYDESSEFFKRYSYYEKTK